MVRLESLPENATDVITGVPAAEVETLPPQAAPAPVAGFQSATTIASPEEPPKPLTTICVSVHDS